MAAVELAFLQVSPIYCGYGIPHGHGEPVVLVPGIHGHRFQSVLHLKMWLRRIGYQTFYSGIAVNADCPNLLIQRNLRESVQQGYASTGRKVHLIAHS